MRMSSMYCVEYMKTPWMSFNCWFMYLYMFLPPVWRALTEIDVTPKQTEYAPLKNLKPQIKSQTMYNKKLEPGPPKGPLIYPIYPLLMAIRTP